VIYMSLSRLGPRKKVLLLPPDFTRFHSQAGKITQIICQYYNFIPHRQDNDGDSQAAALGRQSKEQLETSPSSPSIQILPALGTHAPMTEKELRTMYGDDLTDKDPSPFVVHDWRNDVVTIGQVPAAMVATATDNRITDRTWPAQLNKLVWEQRRELHQQLQTGDGTGLAAAPPPLVLSIGQVVPHEVLGMANFNKNVFVGTGGVQAINLSHFIGAVYGMERMMGKAQNPLRDILNYASQHFLEQQLDLWYFLTVVGPDPASVNRPLALRGLYIGNNIDCYTKACELSLKVNFTLLDKPIERCVVFLDEDEFHSTWLGNKAIYRTRMAMADGGTLIILAPGIERFGEDGKIDKLIRQYGYKGTPTILDHLSSSAELGDNLSAVAHLIHGSTEGRFQVVYCPGHLTKEEIEAVGFHYGDLPSMMQKYQPALLKDGWNNSEETGEQFFYISNPALGLWTVPSKFES
jgi:nickel-dependent lactate racemase